MLNILKIVKDSIVNHGLFLAQAQSPTALNIHSTKAESK